MPMLYSRREQRRMDEDSATRKPYAMEPEDSDLWDEDTNPDREANGSPAEFSAANTAPESAAITKDEPAHAQARSTEPDTPVDASIEEEETASRPAHAPVLAEPSPDIVSAAQGIEHGEVELRGDDVWSSYDEAHDRWEHVSNQASATPARTPENERIASAATSPWGQLVGTGDLQASVFDLCTDNIEVGRDPACALVVDAPSVSRHHARITKTGDDIWIDDLQSANGTFVNNERVTKQRLHPGDRVRLGHAVLLFQSGGLVFRPVDGSQAPVLPHRIGWWQACMHRNTLRTAALIGSIALFVLLNAWAIVIQRGSRPAVTKERAAFAYYQQGVAAFARRDWQEAVGKLQIAASLWPKEARAQRVLRAAQLERSAWEQLNNARDAQRAGRLADAYTAATAIHASMYDPDARALQAGIEAQITAEIVQARVALQRGERSRALAYLSNALEVFPERADVLALAQQVATRSPSPSGARPDNSAAVTRPSPGPENGPASERGSASEDDSARAAKRAFAAGNIDDALRMLEQASHDGRAAALADDVRKFRQAYTLGRDEHQAKHTAAALRALFEARRLNEQISGVHTVVGEDIDHKIADMYYVDGIQQYLRQDLPAAFNSFALARRYWPDHQPAARQLADLEQQAAKLVDEAATLDEAAARRKCDEALSIVSPDSPVATRAKQCR
jgi:tetratricopeptide (TPR) repeat protein